MRGPFEVEQEADLEVQAHVAQPLAVEGEAVAVVHARRADLIRIFVARHDLERQRDARLQLQRPHLEPERGDQRRRDHVGDLVRAVVVALELQHPVAPVGHQTERQLGVTQHLRGVDRDVAARVHRRPEGIELDVAADLRVDRVRAEQQRSDERDGKQNAHDASGTGRGAHSSAATPRFYYQLLQSAGKSNSPAATPRACGSPQAPRRGRAWTGDLALPARSMRYGGPCAGHRDTAFRCR